MKREHLMEWIRSFLPQQSATSIAERGRAVAGAFVGLALTAVLSGLARDEGGIWLIAPMGASAVLLFCLPASPLAQPWSVVGGNVVSALVGIACARFIPSSARAAPLAPPLAIGAMFYLRCLHPPGGAVALTAVVGGAAVLKAGYLFALLPVGLSSLLLTLAALVYNNLTGRRYPNAPQAPLRNVHGTQDPAPTARLGLSKDDLDSALARYDQVLDVSRDDLEALLVQIQQQSYQKRFGVVLCGEIMSKDVISVRPDTPLANAWSLMRRHRLRTLPVLEGLRVAGIVAQSDFLRDATLLDHNALRARVRRAAGVLFSGRKTRVISDIMSADVVTVSAEDPIASLVPLMCNAGLRHIPVVRDDGTIAGMVSQSDLLAALYETHVAPASFETAAA